MKLLLDTHVFLWALRAPERLSDAATEAITDRSNDLCISSVTAFEVATKARIGKLLDVEPILLAWEELTAELQAEELPLTTRHSLVAGRLEWDHRDPFDRLLAGQSLSEGMTLVTGDAEFRSLGGIRVLWD